MTIRVVVVGAGGFGREALDVIEASNRAGLAERIEVVGIIDNNPSAANAQRLASRGLKVLGGIDELTAKRPCREYVLGIGSPQVKLALDARLSAAGLKPVTVVHPSASIGSQVVFGAGTIVCGGVQVSTNVSTGRHVHLNPNCTIGHDSRLEDFVSVNPGAIVSGEVGVGEASLIGAGAVVLQGLSVGAGSTVGASACVTKDVPGAAIVAGVPARRMSDQ